jgi:biopolymer transport protein ExbD
MIYHYQQEEAPMTAKWQPRPIRIPDVGPTINTTPLIDLMLVLLVMLIISIPVSTHKMPLDLPRPDPTPTTPPPVHQLAIAADGRLSWNGRAIADADLAPRLAAMAADPEAPVLHLQADGEARYQRVDETLAVVVRAGITRLGFVGNERFLRTLDGPA